MMKNIIKNYVRNEDGATAVEFGLTAIFFLILMVGVIEGGRLVWTVNGLRFAVQETARYAALNTRLSAEDYTTYAEGKLSDFFISTDELTLNQTSVTSNGVDFVEIDASYDFSLMLGILLPDEWSDIDLNSTSRQPAIN